MDFLTYVRSYAKCKDTAPHEGVPSMVINLITNFTDEIFERVLGGMCLEAGIYPRINRAPYKQYHLLFKNPGDALYAAKPAVSFIFFDINPYARGEFEASPEHMGDTLADIATYCAQASGTTVVSLAPLPYNTAFGHFFAGDPVFAVASEWNRRLQELSHTLPNLYVFDTNKIVHYLGEKNLRDMRGSYAFDMPFTNEFILALVQEWFACIQALTGRSRKCLVLDLDNTLWGGIVGELGPLGIELGPQYPGVAYQNFQRALLKLRERGVILALCSKNNLGDVMEVFEKNPHMILKKEHFAAIRINWEDKSENIADIARELNIGTDAIVFLDDSPLERERMRSERPEVLVPEFSLEPEGYVGALLSLTAFHQMSITDEDRKRSRRYAEESKRTEVLKTAKSKKEYIAGLGISIAVSEGGAPTMPRVAQLTQKTNQFNISTKRYSEADITSLIQKGWGVYSAEVTDKFGSYGTVVVALVSVEGVVAHLDTFLMSCRVMGRDVEFDFLKEVIGRLRTRGVETLTANFVPTAKNTPAKNFLPEAGFKEVNSLAAGVAYELQIAI